MYLFCYKGQVNSRLLSFYRYKKNKTGPPALEASTIPLGYRGGGNIHIMLHKKLSLYKNDFFLRYNISNSRVWIDDVHLSVCPSVCPHLTFDSTSRKLYVVSAFNSIHIDLFQMVFCLVTLRFDLGCHSMTNFQISTCSVPVFTSSGL